MKEHKILKTILKTVHTEPPGSHFSNYPTLPYHNQSGGTVRPARSLLDIAYQRTRMKSLKKGKTLKWIEQDISFTAYYP